MTSWDHDYMYQGYYALLNAAVHLKAELFKGFVENYPEVDLSQRDTRKTGSRKAITSYTSYTRRRFVRCCKGFMPDLAITLTYPRQYRPKDASELKDDQAKLIRRLRLREGAGVLLPEFHKNGFPHFHGLVKGVTRDEVQRSWDIVIGNDGKPSRTFCNRIRGEWHRDKCISYMKDSRKKNVPEAFRPLGKYWTQFGSLDGSPKFRSDRSPIQPSDFMMAA